MGLKKMSERKVGAAPTGLHLTEDRVYLSVKRKYIIETEYGLSKLRKISVNQSIMTMTGTEGNLLCFSEKGSLYSLCLKSNEITRETSFGTHMVRAAIYDVGTGLTMAGTDKSKILVCDGTFESHKTLYGSSSGIIGLAMSGLNQIACISEVESSVRIFDLKSSKCRSIDIPKGFPQAIAYIDVDHIVVGSQNGDLYLINTSETTIMSSISVMDTITALSYRDGFLLIGTEGGKVLLASVVDRELKVIDEYQANGIVNVLYNNKDYAAVGIGKEPRLGRWITKKDGEHKLIVFKIE